MQKIHSYEKEAGEKSGLEKKLVELEDLVATLKQEVTSLKATV